MPMPMRMPIMQKTKQPQVKKTTGNDQNEEPTVSTTGEPKCGRTRDTQNNKIAVALHLIKCAVRLITINLKMRVNKLIAHFKRGEDDLHPENQQNLPDTEDPQCQEDIQALLETSRAILEQVDSTTVEIYDPEDNLTDITATLEKIEQKIDRSDPQDATEGAIVKDTRDIKDEQQTEMNYESSPSTTVDNSDNISDKELVSEQQLPLDLQTNNATQDSSPQQVAKATGGASSSQPEPPFEIRLDPITEDMQKLRSELYALHARLGLIDTESENSDEIKQRANEITNRALELDFLHDNLKALQKQLQESGSDSSKQALEQVMKSDKSGSDTTNTQQAQSPGKVKKLNMQENARISIHPAKQDDTTEQPAALTEPPKNAETASLEDEE